ncbi:hypothetical protein H2198_008787 [Neophaeococcomyces mojaviensis]|uniref:Uncharacterized protein n=1 Tax=Neophaeococcomyces mojaviensis TaxID=3383035 RepID=A0ACC2ZWH1_9EURO|nr:hypothetical protein H2198_008787 [Knufia sp. JES_112]
MSILRVPLAARYRQIAESSTRQGASQTLEQAQALCKASNEETSAHKEAVDAAFREVFYELIASLNIEKDEYAPIWSLLDSVNLLCDHELCEPALGFWLVEDLLDSHTISGCHKVFNYLELRRERMTKEHLKQKNLTILRCCNDLLRRLSRAEDTVFCGRVFIYLFQSFPLGDKSSVNLRGEFHTENLTTFDENPLRPGDGDGEMDVDPQEGTSEPDVKDPSQAVKAGQETVKLDELYPVFWSLQSLFSQPTKLFETASMQQFKDGIGQTMACFTQVINNSTTAAAVQEAEKRGVKRKRGDLDGENTELNSSAFNPRYLTNRDLFDLEIHDIEFRRHMLVQALILLDFLLALTSQSKAKLVNTINTILKELVDTGKLKENQAKSNTMMMKAIYEKLTLSDEDRAWVIETRRTIEKYLEEGNGQEGRYYLRMVNMVLSRDKNWAIWKAANCPEIKRDPVDASVDLQSQDALHEISIQANRPILKPDGADQLAFLSESESVEALKQKRPNIPSLEQYHRAMQVDDLDLEFATEEEVKDIQARKAGRLWRALRSARGKRFTLCEEIRNGDNPDALIGKTNSEEVKGEEVEDGQNERKLTREEEPASGQVDVESAPSAMQAQEA